ncbi:sulfotransferase family 2 domain-containing protein [Vreelandella andesensis]|uniref:sulfotransferase family 2 domain-containing protein n=1 Tax=Vreelandella andesensis TaxID=447567 RepID=UPI001FC90127|nr:sulfotransferase family 2 domain-containing protein [Halomonas andesensis]
MIYKSNNPINKTNFSPDFFFEAEDVSFFFTYIRKNASTSFKKLFQLLYPGACSGDLPSIHCLIKHAQVKELTPEEIDKRFSTKLFVYRDPVDRVFSTYKNKVIQQDGAEDLLRRLEKVVGRDPALLTFDEFVQEYVVLLKTERWEEVDGHLYPQVWHLLPITYNKVIRMDNVYHEMCELLPAELCDRVFKEPTNSTTKGSVPLAWADPDCPAIYFRKKYARGKLLPSLSQLLTPATEARLREVYADDYRMIEEIEVEPDSFMLTESSQPAGLNFSIPAAVNGVAPECALGLDFSLLEKRSRG